MNFTLGTEIARRGGLHEVGEGGELCFALLASRGTAQGFDSWIGGKDARALLAKLPGHCGVRPRKERRRYGLAGCAAAQIADEATS